MAQISLRIEDEVKKKAEQASLLPFPVSWQELIGS